MFDSYAVGVSARSLRKWGRGGGRQLAFLVLCEREALSNKREAGILIGVTRKTTRSTGLRVFRLNRQLLIAKPRLYVERTLLMKLDSL